MTSFEKLITSLERHYYASLIMAIFELIAIIACITLIRKDKTAILFVTYLLFDFSILISSEYLRSFSHITKEELTFYRCISNTLISCVELFVYYYFFLKTIDNKKAVDLMKLSRLLFLCVIIVFVTTRFRFLTTRYEYVADIIGVIEFLLLLIPCFYYFYKLIKDDPALILYERPSFWIATGILFYSVMSIPYLLIDGFLINNRSGRYLALLDLALYYLPFTINFILLTRAFLCKKTLTT